MSQNFYNKIKIILTKSYNSLSSLVKLNATSVSFIFLYKMMSRD